MRKSYLRSVGDHFLFSSLGKRHMCNGDLRPWFCILNLQSGITGCYGAKKEYLQIESMGLVIPMESGLKVLLYNLMNQRRQEASMRSFETRLVTWRHNEINILTLPKAVIKGQACAISMRIDASDGGYSSLYRDSTIIHTDLTVEVEKGESMGSCNGIRSVLS